MEIQSINEKIRIPESENNLRLKAALQETLEKAQGIDLLLTGGTSAAVYAGEKRPLSLDLDFFVKPEDREEIKNRFGGDYIFFKDKKLFKSDKLVGQSANEVDLDFIEIQNIVPDEKNLEKKIVFEITPLVEENAIEADFMGEKVRVMPPECVVIAKLFAGRGEDLGKYDLKDSKSIIETGIVRADVFEKIVLELTQGEEETLELVKTRLLAALDNLKETPKVKLLKNVLMEVQLEDLQDERESVKKDVSGCINDLICSKLKLSIS